MAVDKQSRDRLPDWAGNDKPTGVKLDAGPFIGIIKNNLVNSYLNYFRLRRD